MTLGKINWNLTFYMVAEFAFLKSVQQRFGFSTMRNCVPREKAWLKNILPVYMRPLLDLQRQVREKRHQERIAISGIAGKKYYR